MRFARVGDSDWAFAANVSIGRPAAVAVLIFKLLNDTTDSITVSNDLTGNAFGLACLGAAEGEASRLHRRVLISGLERLKGKIEKLKAEIVRLNAITRR
jgi:hypothetical protein